MGPQTIRLGLVQMSGSADPAENMEKAVRGVRDAAARVNLPGHDGEVLLARGVLQEAVDRELPEQRGDIGLGDERHLLGLELAKELELRGAAGFFGRHGGPGRSAVICLDAARGNKKSEALARLGQPRIVYFFI